MQIVFMTAVAYLLGSISFAVVTAKVFRLPDPRSYGSGNPGATNVLRTGNKVAALVTLLGDALKGVAAVWIATRAFSGSPLREAAVALSGLAAFIGHLYPVFFSFKGGKGVATALGILFAFSLKLGLLVAGIWLLIVATTRYVSLASVIGAVAAAPVGISLGASPLMAVTLSVMGLLIVWRHVGNLQRLRAGTESRLFARKP